MIIIDQFPGLVTNASPYALPVGAAVTQVNLQCLSPGRLSVRPGDATFTWSSHTGGTSPIRAAVRFQHSTVETVVYQDAAGGIFIAKGAP
jgi:hypothetical protein